MGEAGSVTGDARVDRVAAAGGALALAACLLLPFAVLRANRIVAGVPHDIRIAGEFGWLAVLTSAGALVAAFRTRAALLGEVLFVMAAGMTLSLAWGLGSAVTVLREGAPAFSRVSVGSGAWLASAGTGVVWFAAVHHGMRRGWKWATVALTASGLAGAAFLGGLADLSIVFEYRAQAGSFWSTVGSHLSIAGGSLAIATLIGIPLGIAASRVEWVRTLALGSVGVIQTVPSLALLGLLVVPLSAAGLPGIGPLPAVIALTLYALLPIVRNTYIGLAGVDPAAIDAGQGMGMDRGQLLWRVEAPLALPLVIEGVRAAAVMVIGITAVVAFIGVNTLGVLVFQGWGQQADDLILLGAVPMVALAIAADWGLRRLARTLVSPGIRQETA